MTHRSVMTRSANAFFALSLLGLVALPSLVTAQTPAATTPDKAMTPAGKSMDMGKDKGMTMGKGAPMAGGQGDMHSAMMANMKSMESTPMTGNIDRDFAAMMKIHHQGAVDMAQMELKNGKDSGMREMAKRIIAAQQKEIKEFDRWLATHK